MSELTVDQQRLLKDVLCTIYENTVKMLLRDREEEDTTWYAQADWMEANIPQVIIRSASVGVLLEYSQEDGTELEKRAEEIRSQLDILWRAMTPESIKAVKAVITEDS